MKADPEQIEEGEWYAPTKRGHKEVCCDCALVHRVNYRIRKGVLEIQVFRDERATAARRRKRKRQLTANSVSQSTRV